MFLNSNSGRRLQPLTRWLLLFWSLLLLAGFGVAAGLKPDPRGFGTHQALGLPPCTVRLLLGIPCPSCGMTTSFSHFIRGQFVDSVRANAAGFLLASVCLLQIPWCLVSAGRGRLLGLQNPLPVLLWSSLVFCFAAVAQWLIWVLP